MISKEVINDQAQAELLELRSTYFGVCTTMRFVRFGKQRGHLECLDRQS